MSLATDIAKKRLEIAQPKRCKLGVLLDSLDVEDMDAMDYAMKSFSSAWLVTVLNKNGHSIGKTVISDHLSGRCACEQAGE